MKNLSVRTQLLTLVILAVLGFLTLGGMVLRSEYLALRAASIERLTWLTESTLRIVTSYEDAASQGKLSEAEAQARKLLQRVGLAEKFDAMPDQLSGGQQQRVAIARALAMEPQVLLCDEITSALDPELVGEVLRVVESLAQEGMTLMMVTHEMAFARKVSDRVIFMHQGRVHEEGTPTQLFGSPQTPELQQFLSSLHD